MAVETHLVSSGSGLALSNFPLIGMGLTTVLGWEYRLYIGTPGTTPKKWYNVSHYAELDNIAESLRALGQASQLKLALKAETMGVAIPITPRNGYEILFYKHNLTNPLQHEYLFGGKMKVRTRRPTPENQIYAITAYDFSFELNRQIQEIAWDGTTYPTDASRILDLGTKAFTGSGLTWDFTSSVTPIANYPVSNLTRWYKRSVSFILADIQAYTGDPAQTGYPLPARRVHIGVAWTDPANPGADGNSLTRIYNYYSADKIIVEDVPLSDNATGLAHYNASDFFFSPGSSTVLGVGINNQAWVEYGSAAWGRVSSKAYVRTGSAGVHAAAGIYSGTYNGDVVTKWDTNVTGMGTAGRLAPDGVSDWSGYVARRNGANLELIRRGGGVNTVLRTYTPGAFANGDIIGIRFTDGRVVMLMNGVEVGGAQTGETQNATSRIHGLYSNLGGAGAARWDDYAVTYYAAPYYEDWESTTDLTPVVNVLPIEGPGDDFGPVNWQNLVKAAAQNDGTIGKSGATTLAYDSGGSSKQFLTEDGGEIRFIIAPFLLGASTFSVPDRNDNLGPPNKGPDWLARVGVGGVSAGTARAVSTVGRLVQTQALEASSSVILELDLVTSGTGAGIVFRYNDTNNYWYAARNGSNYSLYKRSGGVDSTISTSAGFAAANGDSLKVNLEGNNIQVWAKHAGGAYTLLLSTTDAFNNTYQEHGLFILDVSSGVPRLDNWKAYTTYGTRAIGFTYTDSNQTLGDIEWGFQFLNTRSCSVVESGSLIGGTAHTYSQGDEYRIDVALDPNTGSLKTFYYRRASGTARFVLLYTSTVQPIPNAVTPLYVDTAFLDPAATFMGVSIRAHTYHIYRNAQSIIDNQGEYWAKGTLKDQTLDTEAKRQARADAFFARYGDQRQHDKVLAVQPYTNGRAVLYTNTRAGIVDQLRVIASVQPKRESGVAGGYEVEYIYTLGDSEREYGDDDPLGFLVRGITDDGEGPDPPSGLTFLSSVPDSPTTCSALFQWVQTTGDEEWVELEITNARVPQAHPPYRFPASGNLGLVPGLAPHTPYYARPRALDYNGNEGPWGDQIPFTTAEEAAPPAPNNFHNTGNAWDPGQGSTLLSWAWDPVGVNDLHHYLFRWLIAGVIFGPMIVARESVTYQHYVTPGATVAAWVTAVDNNGNEGPESTRVQVIADSVAAPIGIYNPDFEIPNPTYPTKPDGWIETTLGGGSVSLISGSGNTYSGKNAIRFHQIPGGAVAILQDFPLTPSSPIYCALAQRNATGNTQSIGVQLQAWDRKPSDPGAVMLGSYQWGLLPTGTGWQYTLRPDTWTPPAGTVYGRAYLFSNNNGTTYDIDFDYLILATQKQLTELAPASVDGTKWVSSVVASSALTITPPAANQVPLSVVGYASQTADLFRIRNSSLTDLLRVDSSGKLGIGGAPHASYIAKIVDSLYIGGSGATFLLEDRANSALAWSLYTSGSFRLYSTSAGADRFTVATDGVVTPTNKITKTGELQLEMTGDEFGDCRLFLWNRTNYNGPKFQAGTSVSLIDYVLEYWSGSAWIPNNFRIEGRSSYTDMGTTPEWQLSLNGTRVHDVSSVGLKQLSGYIDAQTHYRINGTQVVTTKRTGWGAPTGTATRTTFATTTVTLQQLAERVKALIDDLTTHGLIGA